MLHGANATTKSNFIECNLTLHTPQQTLLPTPAPLGPPRPSRVILLTNMVSADEVDAELQGEVKEECNKISPVGRVVIYITPDTV